VTGGASEQRKVTYVLSKIAKVTKFCACVDLVKKRETQIFEIRVLSALLYSQSDTEYNEVVCCIRGLKSFFV